MISALLYVFAVVCLINAARLSHNRNIRSIRAAQIANGRDACKRALDKFNRVKPVEWPEKNRV